MKETQPNSDSSFNKDVEVRIDDFLVVWPELSSDKSEEGKLRFEAMVESLRADDRLSGILYSRLAAMDTEDGWRKAEEITCLLEALHYLATPEQSKDVIRLLYDADSPLWQKKEFLFELSDIGDNLHAAQFSYFMTDIATANVMEKGGIVYHSHLGRIILLLVRARSNSEDTEEKQIYSMAIKHIQNIQVLLRPQALAAIHSGHSETPPGYWSNQAKEEARVLGKQATLLSMYHLKAVPELTSGQAPDQERGFPELVARHQLGELEANPHPATPTIGIEIEVRKDALLPEDSADWTFEQKQEYLARLKTKFENIEFSLIPPDVTDTHAFHEFAFEPKHNYLTLSREVQMLKKRGFIPESLRPPAMHITIGGINAKLDRRQENEAFALCRIIEATAWSTSHHRLLRRYARRTDEAIGWDCKGLAGVLDKKHDSFIKTNTDAAMVEFRTFQLKDIAGMNRTLAAFQTLGAAAAAAQRARGFSSGSKDMSDDDLELAAIWGQFESEVKQLFSEHGLRNPKRPYAPLQPENDTEGRYLRSVGAEELHVRSGFYKLAELLKEATEDPTSDGSLFVSDARKLVIEAGRKIAPVIYKR